MLRLKRSIKNLIEDFSRLFHKDNLFYFYYNKKKITFFLPLKRDYIQQQIIIKRNFYEAYFLKSLLKFLIKKEISLRNKIIFDVGANIGNHTIFFSKFLRPKRIYSFEPQPFIFNILKKNVEINELERKVYVKNVALGKKNTFGSFSFFDPNNTGLTQVKEEKNNLNKKVIIKKLDDFRVREKIGLIKIDVEGAEYDVLLGAKNILKNQKPILWIEIQKKNEKKVFNLLSKIGYKLEKKFDQSNYLFSYFT